MSANFPRLQWIIGTPVRDLLYWLVLQFPAAMVQTLPIALLLAVLLSFGRLAAANELLAIQAGGVALRRIAGLMLMLGLAAAGFALAMNQFVLPWTNVRVGSLWWELTGGGSGLARLTRQNLPLGDYTLSFDATATPGATVRAAVQLGADPYTSYFSRDVALTPTRQHLEYTFTVSEDTSAGQVAFQVGGGAAAPGGEHGVAVPMGHG